MKKVSLSVLPFVAASLILTTMSASIGYAQNTPPQGADINSSKTALKDLDPATVAATLNGKTITVADLDRELERPEMAAYVGNAKNDPTLRTKLRASALSSMISRDLLLQAARNSKKITPTEVQKEVDTFVQTLGGKDKLMTALTAHGVTWDKFTEEISDGVRLKQFVEQDISDGLKVSDEDAKKAFDANPKYFTAPEMVKARHILISLAPDAPSADQKAALEKAQVVRAKAIDPKSDFAKLAEENSNDDMSKVNGGDLGFFRRGMMVSEFEDAAFSLKVGEVSEPIKTKFGYHIIKVDEHKDAEKPNFETSKEMVKKTLLGEERNKAIKAKIGELRKLAKVDITLPELKDAAKQAG